MQFETAPAAAEAEAEAPPLYVAVPNAKAHAEALEGLQQRLEAAQAGVLAVNAKVDELLQQRDVQRRRRRGHEARRRRQHQQIQAAHTALQQANHDVAEAETSRSQDAARLRALKAKLKFASEKQLDQAVAAMEAKVDSGSLPVSQEAVLLRQIRSAKATRPQILAYETTAADVHAKASLHSLAAVIKARDAASHRLTHLQQLEANAAEAVEQHSRTEKRLNGEIEALLQQRKATAAQIRDLKQTQVQTKRVYEKLKRDRRVYVQAMRQYEQAQKRRVAEQKKQERRQRRDQERSEWEAEAALRDVYENEKEACSSILSYLRALKPSQYQETIDRYCEGTVAAAVHPPEVHPSPPQAPQTAEGAREVVGKGETLVEIEAPSHAAEDDLFARSGEYCKTTKSSKRRKGGRQWRNKRALQHTPDVYLRFECVGVTPPRTLQELPRAISKVLERQQYYENAPSPGEIRRSEALRRAMVTEQKQRNKRRATAIGMANAEQKRRVEEARLMDEEVKLIELRERTHRIDLAIKLEEAEKQRRIREEHEAALLDMEMRHERIQLAMELEKGERFRRVSEVELAAVEALEESVMSSEAARDLAVEAAEAEREDRMRLLGIAIDDDDRAAIDSSEEEIRRWTVAYAVQVTEAERKRQMDEMHEAIVAADDDTISAVIAMAETERLRRLQEPMVRLSEFLQEVQLGSITRRKTGAVSRPTTVLQPDQGEKVAVQQSRQVSDTPAEIENDDDDTVISTEETQAKVVPVLSSEFLQEVQQGGDITGRNTEEAMSSPASSTCRSMPTDRRERVVVQQSRQASHDGADSSSSSDFGA